MHPHNLPLTIIPPSAQHKILHLQNIHAIISHLESWNALPTRKSSTERQIDHIHHSACKALYKPSGFRPVTSDRSGHKAAAFGRYSCCFAQITMHTGRSMFRGLAEVELQHITNHYF
jgi:hypothetical protein